MFSRALTFLRGPAPVYLVAAVLGRLGSMLLIPMYTRRLSVSEYGDFALAQSILSFLPLVFTLGLISAVPKFYYSVDDRALGRRNAGTVALWMSVIAIAMATLALGGVALFAEGGSGGIVHRYELGCVVVAAAGAALSTIPDAFFRAEQRPYPAAAYQLIQFALQLSMGLLFVSGMGRGLRGAIEAVTVAYAIGGVAGLGFTLFYLRGRLERSLLRAALPFALPFMPHFIANWIQIAADRWTLKAYHLEGALGGYALAAQLTAPIALVVAAYNDVSSAQMGEAFRTGGIAGIRRGVKKTYVAYLVAAVVPAIAIVAMLPLIVALVGGRFASAIPLIPFMAAFSVVETMYFPNSNVLYYSSHTRTIAAVTMSSAVISIALNLGLVPIFGVSGSLAARFITAAARSLAIWTAARSRLRATEAS